MRKLIVGVGLLSALCASGAEAQEQRYWADVRLLGAAPGGAFVDWVDHGVGLDATVGLRVSPAVALYGAVGRTSYGAPLGGGGEQRATEQGVASGLILSADAGEGGVRVFGNVGVVLHSLDFPGRGDEISTEPGYEFGGGLEIPLRGNLSLTPAMRYRHFDTRVHMAEGDAYFEGDMAVDALTVGVGLRVGFGR